MFMVSYSSFNFIVLNKFQSKLKLRDYFVALGIWQK